MDTSDSFSADIGGCLRRGWELYKREALSLSGATVVMVFLLAVANSVPFAGMLLAAPLFGGLYLVIIKITAGESFVFTDFFHGFKFFVPLLVASLLTGLFTAVGMALFVLPGIYLALAYAFTTLNIVDGHMDFWPAMETSRKAITAHFWDYLLLSIIMFAIITVSAIPMGLGLFISLPVCLATQYCFYKDMKAHYGGELPV